MKKILFILLILTYGISQAQNYSEVQKTIASDRGAAQDRFGNSVSISGNYMVVGAYNEDENESGGNTITGAGSAYIYEKVGDAWIQVQKIVASDRAAQDRFGFSVSISGDYIVVGAYNEDENESGGNTLSGAGSAYIYERIGGVWTDI